MLGIILMIENAGAYWNMMVTSNPILGGRVTYFVSFVNKIFTKEYFFHCSLIPEVGFLIMDLIQSSSLSYSNAL